MRRVFCWLGIHLWQYFDWVEVSMGIRWMCISVDRPWRLGFYKQDPRMGPDCGTIRIGPLGFFIDWGRHA